jgi:hypothetical protein
MMLPAGLVRDATGVVAKDPNREVQERIALVFTSFLELGSVGKVMRTFQSRGLGVPRRDRCGEVAWRPATADRISRILKNPAYAGTFVYGRTRSCRTPPDVRFQELRARKDSPLFIKGAVERVSHAWQEAER